MNGRLSDTRVRPAVRFCAHCGHRPPPDRNGEMRVCARCGLGILISAPGDAAPGVGEPFVIVDGHLTVRALSQHAETLLGVRERRAIGRDLDELLVQPATCDPDTTGLETAITQSAQGDVAFAGVEVRLVNAGHAHLRVRIGPCGPPPAALIVLENFS